MTNFIVKQQASRIVKMQNIQWTGTGTVVSTNFASGTQHIRVCSQLAGWMAIDNLGTVPTTAGGLGAFLPNSTVGGEYFTCTPGEIFSFSSTTTSSGSWISISEMA